MIRAALLVLALSSSPALAQEFGHEIPSDTASAIADGFTLASWDNPAPVELVERLLAPIRARLGIRAGEYGFNSFAPYEVVPGHTVLFVQAKGQPFDVPGLQGQRLFVFAMDHSAAVPSWRLVLDTAAMFTGYRPYEIAAVQPQGYLRFAWADGEFRAVPSAGELVP